MRKGVQPLDENFTLGGVITHADTLPVNDLYANYCTYSQEMSERVDEFVIGPLERSLWGSAHDIKVQILRAKGALHEIYYAWRKAAPKKHQRMSGAGHHCLFHVYEEACERIKKIELTKCPAETETKLEQDERIEREKQEQEARKPATPFPGIGGLDDIVLGMEA